MVFPLPEGVADAILIKAANSGGANPTSMMNAIQTDLYKKLMKHLDEFDAGYDVDTGETFAAVIMIRCKGTTCKVARLKNQIASKKEEIRKTLVDHCKEIPELNDVEVLFATDDQGVGVNVRSENREFERARRLEALALEESKRVHCSHFNLHRGIALLVSRVFFRGVAKILSISSMTVTGSHAERCEAAAFYTVQHECLRV